MNVIIHSRDVFGNEYEHVVEKAVSIIAEDKELFVFSKNKDKSKRYPMENVEEIEVII